MNSTAKRQLRFIFLDFETYYDSDYSLRKMTPVEYVLDPRFDCLGCAIKIGVGGESFWLDGPELPAFFQSLDPETTALVTHNALFDMCIVAWRYGFLPKLIVDTLGASRAVLAHKLRSLSLENVANHLQLGAKGKTLIKVLGMNMAMIRAAGLYDEFVGYAITDVNLCAGIYEKLVLSGRYPARQLFVMDMVLRCAIQPSFRLDREALALHLHEVKVQKEQQLALAMLAGADGTLRSRPAQLKQALIESSNTSLRHPTRQPRWP